MNIGRRYRIVFEEVAISAAQDLIEIVAPSDAVVILHEWAFYQSSDAGDAESEQLNIIVHRGSTSGSGGSTATPRPNQLGDAAFGGTAEVNNTTQGTEGDILDTLSFNVMAGAERIYTPESVKVISPSGRLIVELQTAPTDTITGSGYAEIEEIGG